MSEETPPAKKAARKSVRKKTAKKAAQKKSESPASEEQLPLAESNSSPAGDSPKEPASTDDQSSSGETAPAKEQKGGGRGREPKSKVRDARTDKGGDADPVAESVEKLVPESESNERKEQPKGRSREKENDQSDNGERRGRNRGRRNRNEKREEAPRTPVSTKLLKKKAWKIFESEVTEEGLALLDDNGLREYARSSFNAARLFLEEAARVEARQEEQKKRNKQKAKSEKEENEQD